MVNVTTSYSSKHFLLEALSNYWTFPLVTTGFFWQCPKYLEFHTLLSLFEKGSNKQQQRGGIITNFTKGETFLISYNNQVLLGVILR